MESRNLKDRGERRRLAADLNEWRAAAVAALPMQVPRPSFNDPTLSEVVAATLIARVNCVRERSQQLRSMPAGQWINSQREIDRAIELLYGRRRRNEPQQPHRTIEQWSADLLAGVRQRALKKLDGEIGQEPEGYLMDLYLHDALEDCSHSPYRFSWMVAFARSLAEYLHGEAAETMIAAQQEYVAAAKEFKMAAARFNEVAQRIEGLELPRLRRIAPPGLGRIVNNMKFELEGGCLPLKRRSEGQDEKLFVFRMYEANRRAVGKPRTEAIHELMHLDLFQRQFDRRHLDRLVAEFTAMYEDRKVSNLAGQKPS